MNNLPCSTRWRDHVKCPKGAISELAGILQIACALQNISKAVCDPWQNFQNAMLPLKTHKFDTLAL